MKELEDLTNKKFGKLIVIRYLYTIKYQRFWECKCDCGNNKILIIKTSRLKSGNASHCGCQPRPFLKDMTGFKSGKLEVIKFSRSIPRSESGKKDHFTLWWCKCDCGNPNLVEVSQSEIKSKHRKSCGCKARIWKGHEDVSGRYFSSLRAGAKRRKIEFNITPKDIWLKFLEQDKKCAFTGKPLIFIRTCKCKSLQTASVDRIDSKKGYSPDNIQIIHKFLNWPKSNIQNNEFIEWCCEVAVNHRGKDNFDNSMPWL